MSSTAVLTDEAILAALEEYLALPPPRGYTSRASISAGIPRSAYFCPLAAALRYKFGGKWEVYLRNDTARIYQGVLSNYSEYIDTGPLLTAFTRSCDRLHREVPGMWCGDVTFWEAQRCLDDAKQKGEEEVHGKHHD